MTSNLLTPLAQFGLSFVDACDGDLDLALRTLESLRPIVAARRLEALAAIQRRAAQTPVEAPPSSPAARPNTGGLCVCGSGRAFAECHGADGSDPVERLLAAIDMHEPAIPAPEGSPS